MYEGYLSLSGIELMNAERTAAYVKHASIAIPFKPSRKLAAPSLHVALGDEEYESPLIDDAEWVDPNDPDTHGFFGMYPLSVEGIGDSTREAGVTESTTDGGTVGRSRDGTRSIRVRGLLIGADELAVESGLAWLRAAVRTDSCGTHGEMCGTNDLRYFLAAPDVCMPKWGPGAGTEITDSVGSISPAYSPLIYDVPLYRSYDNLSPADVRWNVPLVDGAIIRWGQRDLSTDEVLWSSAATTLLRTNYINNPRFAIDTTHWTVGGTGVLSQFDTGGPTGGSYGQFFDSSAALTRTNWLPDPAFTLNVSETMWRTNGATVEYIASAFTSTVDSRIARFAGDSNTFYPLTAEVTALGPTTPAISTVSMYLLQSQAVQVEVFDNTGDRTFTQAFSLPDPIQRISFVTEVGQNYTIRITSGGTEIKVAGVMVEDGALLSPFFYGGGLEGGLTLAGYGLGGYGMGGYGEGEEVPAPSSDPSYFYLDGTPFSASRFQDNTLSLVTALANLGDAPYGNVIAGMDLRSAVGAEVVLQLISTDDGSVLGTRTVSLTDAWDRFYISVPQGRKARLSIASLGSFDLTNVVLEAGMTPLPYFDGDTELEDYEIGWLSTPHQSFSRATWTGSTQILSDTSDWRPYLTVLQGTLHGVSITYVDPDQISLQQQLDPYERTYHRVSVIEGPQIIKWHRMSTGAAVEVDMILLAASPFAFSNDLHVPVALGDSIEYVEPVPETLTNWVRNPSAESTTLSLETYAAGATVTRSSTTNSTWPADGIWSYILDLNSTATHGARMVLTQRPAAAAGERWHFRSRVHIGNETLANVRIRMSAVFYSDAAGAAGNNVINTQYREVLMSKKSKPNHDFSFSAVAPAGTQSVGFTVLRVAGLDSPGVGDLFYVDRLSMIESAATTPPLYFSGNTARTAEHEFRWTGAVNNSPSERVLATTPLLSDPLCPAPPKAPRAPVILEDCTVDIPLWDRYSIPVPASNISLWSGTVPTLTFSTGAVAKRQIRVRFYQNPFDYESELVDPGAYCGEFVIGYIPPNSTLSINGVTQTTYAQVQGSKPVSADHLIYGSEGAPPEWPMLSCAIPYVVTIDVEPTQIITDMEIDLVVNRRE